MLVDCRGSLVCLLAAGRVHYLRDAWLRSCSVSGVAIADATLCRRTVVSYGTNSTTSHDYWRRAVVAVNAVKPSSKWKRLFKKKHYILPVTQDCRSWNMRRWLDTMAESFIISQLSLDSYNTNPSSLFNKHAPIITRLMGNVNPNPCTGSVCLEIYCLLCDTAASLSVSLKLVSQTDSCI